MSREASVGPSPVVRALALLGLFAVVLAVYAPSAGFGFIHDDRQLVLRQPMPASLLEVASVFGEPHWPGLPYYRPVSRSTMVLQKYLHGDDPAPFHRFNVVLMGLTAWVLFALLRGRPFRVGFWPAWLAAAAFALHPVASHVVYPICSGRETGIPSFLMLCATLAWLAPGARAYGVALLFTGLSILAKEQAAVLPALFVWADLLGVTAAPPGRDAGRWARRYAPIVALFAIYFVVRTQLFGSALYHVAVFDRPLQPLLTLVYTLQTAFVPFVALVYEPRLAAWWSWPRFAVTLAAVAALLFGAWRTTPARRRQLLFFAGWWGVALLPTANLLQQESPFAERYGFLSLAALVAIVALFVSDAWDAWRGPARRGLAAVCVAALAALAWISFARGPGFADEAAFATAWVRSDPGSYKAQLNRGQEYVQVEDWERAAHHLGLAAGLRPGSATILNGWAYALWRSGDAAAAAQRYEEAIRVAPRLAAARAGYGALLLSEGDARRAAAQLEQAAQLMPRDAALRLRLGRALRRSGRPEDALRQLEVATRLDPASVQTLVELGELLEEQGDMAAARRRYESALALRPDHPRARAGLARLTAPPRAPR
ncbi:MAG: tetratricopeptide repeat protein [Myxococcota bacterium]